MFVSHIINNNESLFLYLRGIYISFSVNYLSSLGFSHKILWKNLNKHFG